MSRPLGDALSVYELQQLMEYVLTAERAVRTMTRQRMGRHHRIKQFINREVVLALHGHPTDVQALRATVERLQKDNDLLMRQLRALSVAAGGGSRHA